MRLPRLQPLLHALLESSPQVKSVKAVSDVEGYKRHGFGHVIELPTGVRILTQLISIPAPDERSTEPETIVEGEPPAEVPVPELYDGGKLQVAAVPQWFAALICNSGNREVASAEVLEGLAIKHATRIDYHNGGANLIYVVRVFSPGEQVQEGREYRVPATV